MRYINWNVPLRGDWLRGAELVELSFTGTLLRVLLLEEDTETKWEFLFRNVQAFRRTTQECARFVVKAEGVNRPFMKVENSDWIKNLGASQISFLDKSQHFVIFSYDDLIEVVAWDCVVEKRE
jgi:hypothetical protein